MNERYKAGNEFLPYHPQASHVDPSYRDGWNACYKAARAALPVPAASPERLQQESLGHEAEKVLVDNLPQLYDVTTDSTATQPSAQPSAPLLQQVLHALELSAPLPGHETKWSAAINAIYESGAALAAHAAGVAAVDPTAPVMRVNEFGGMTASHPSQVSKSGGELPEPVAEVVAGNENLAAVKFTGPIPPKGTKLYAGPPHPSGELVEAARRYLWLREHFDSIAVADLSGGWDVAIGAFEETGDPNRAAELDALIDRSMAALRSALAAINSTEGGGQ